MNEDKDVSLFDIKEILQDIWKGKFFILALMIVSSLTMAIRVEFFVSEKYTADGVLYIHSQNQRDSGVTRNEIIDARVMSTTYMETLKLRSLLMEVSEEPGNVYSWKQIRKKRILAKQYIS